MTDPVCGWKSQGITRLRRNLRGRNIFSAPRIAGRSLRSIRKITWKPRRLRIEVARLPGLAAIILVLAAYSRFLLSRFARASE